MTGTWFCEAQQEPSMHLSTPNKYNEGSCYTSRNQVPASTFSQIVRHCIQDGCPLGQSGVKTVSVGFLEYDICMPASSGLTLR